MQGCLLQLGDVKVARKDIHAPNNEMEVTNTAVLKVQMFQDEFPIPWTNLTASFIKHLIALIPKIRGCTNVHCDYKRGLFDVAVKDSFDQVIHEIWGRRYQTLEGKAVPADQAALFQVYLRIAAPTLAELLASIVEGIYLEPRSDVTRSTGPDYSVIWLAGATRDSAHHKLKTTSHGLVRMKQCYGIRVLTTYEAAAHAELRPGDDCIKVNVAKVSLVNSSSSAWTSAGSCGQNPSGLEMVCKASSTFQRQL